MFYDYYGAHIELNVNKIRKARESLQAQQAA